jgi:oligopeptide transport system substrate-binding protein
VEAAKKLLADAGYPDGENFEITLTWSQSPSNDLLGQIIQQMWQDNLGITVNLTPTEAQAFRAWRNSLSDLSLHYDCYLIANGTDFEDPYNYHVQLFQSDQGDYYKFRWVNPEYDALAKAESVELDPAKREEIALQADAILARDMPAIPIHYLHNSRLVKPYVRDLQWLHVSTDRPLHKVWIAEH